MKYVFLEQMRQYKNNRAVKGNDKFDVAAIDSFLSSASPMAQLATKNFRDPRGHTKTPR